MCEATEEIRSAKEAVANERTSGHHDGLGNEYGDFASIHVAALACDVARSGGENRSGGPWNKQANRGSANEERHTVTDTQSMELEAMMKAEVKFETRFNSAGWTLLDM